MPSACRCCIAALIYNKSSADKLASKKLRARKVATSEVVCHINSIDCFVTTPLECQHRELQNARKCGVEVAARAALHLHKNGYWPAWGGRSLSRSHFFLLVQPTNNETNMTLGLLHVRKSLYECGAILSDEEALQSRL